MPTKELLPSGLHSTCETVDGLSPQARALVHEFGYSVVKAFDMAGIRNPVVIRRLVHAVWLGPREPANVPPRGRGKNRTMATLDQAITLGHIRNAEGLVNWLRTLTLAIVPIDPTQDMVDASIAETGKLGLASKEQKHRARLRAAIRASFLMPKGG